MLLKVNTKLLYMQNHFPQPHSKKELTRHTLFPQIIAVPQLIAYLEYSPPLDRNTCFKIIAPSPPLPSCHLLFLKSPLYLRSISTVSRVWSLGEWVRAHFSKQQLVSQPTLCQAEGSWSGFWCCKTHQWPFKLRRRGYWHWKVIKEPNLKHQKSPCSVSDHLLI